MGREMEVRELWMERVVKVGVSCGQVKADHDNAYGWIVDCMLMPGAHKESAKEALASFLRDAWHAENVRFFQKHDAPPYKFWVRFTSQDF